MSSSESDDDFYIPAPDRVKRPRFNDSDLFAGVDYQIYGEDAFEKTKKKAEEEFDNNTNSDVKVGAKDSVAPERPRLRTNNDDNIILSDSSHNNDVEVICSPLKEPTPPPSPSPARTTRNSGTTRRGRRGRGTGRSRSRGRGRKTRRAARGTQARDNQTRGEGSDSYVISDEEEYQRLVIEPRPHNTEHRQLQVKVKFSNSVIQRFSMGQHESFDKVVSEIASESGVASEQVELYLGERRVYEYDTVDSAQVTIADILDVLIIRDRRLLNTEDIGDETVGADTIEIFVQSNLRRNKTSFTINKTDTLDRVLRLYCTQHSLDHQHAAIMFDGELLQKWQTPHNLDMEDEDCIDILFTT